jgi:hypothetical protein
MSLILEVGSEVLSRASRAIKGTTLDTPESHGEAP